MPEPHISTGGRIFALADRGSKTDLRTVGAAPSAQPLPESAHYQSNGSVTVADGDNLYITNWSTPGDGWAVRGVPPGRTGLCSPEYWEVSTKLIVTVEGLGDATINPGSSICAWTYAGTGGASLTFAPVPGVPALKLDDDGVTVIIDTDADAPLVAPKIPQFGLAASTDGVIGITAPFTFRASYDGAGSMVVSVLLDIAVHNRAWQLPTPT